MVGGFCLALLFLFVPETFWDRAPRPRSRNTSRSTSKFTSQNTSKSGSKLSLFGRKRPSHAQMASETDVEKNSTMHRPARSAHVAFAPADAVVNVIDTEPRTDTEEPHPSGQPLSTVSPGQEAQMSLNNEHLSVPRPATHPLQDRVRPAGGAPPTPGLLSFNSRRYTAAERGGPDYFSMNGDGSNSFTLERPSSAPAYTTFLKHRPALTFVQQLKPFNGRLHQDKWLRVAVRPFILFAYPAVLWSSIVYSCSVGWLIVLSESVAVIYRSPTTYGFSALSTGLIYISPFVGGVLGTAVAGKFSDIIVRAMSRRNGGLYEPEFRLVMAVPIAITTVIGLMGFGWSAKVHDAWIVPTIFFGIISFGCSLGSTTAITFCVDSYRQYAGEALVTLNFSKNIFHGLVFSLFFTSWLEHDGSKSVFIWVGVIQLILMTLTIPMYIYGKRARMWTVRKNLMEKF